MRTQTYLSLVLLTITIAACGGQMLDGEDQTPEEASYHSTSTCGVSGTTYYCSCNPYGWKGDTYDDAGACTGAPLSTAKAKTLLGTSDYAVLEGAGADHNIYCSRYRECSGTSCGPWMNGTASTTAFLTGKATSYPLGDLRLGVNNYYQLRLSKPGSSYTIGWLSRGFEYPHGLNVKAEAPLPSSTSLTNFSIVTSGDSGPISSTADPGMSLEVYHTSNPSKIMMAKAQITDNCGRLKIAQMYVDRMSGKIYQVEAVSISAF